MQLVSVKDYCSKPEYHQMQGKTTVPKPTVFKQIHESRLPANVEAVRVGNFYLLKVYEPGELCELVTTVKKQTVVLFTGLRSELEKLAAGLNSIYKNNPLEVRPKA